MPLQLQPRFYVRPAFWAGVIILACFIAPVQPLLWMNPEAYRTASGIGFVLEQIRAGSIIAYAFLGLPLLAILLIITEVFGLLWYTLLLRKALSALFVLFFVIHTVTTFHWGFWLTGLACGYLWYESSPQSFSTLWRKRPPPRQ